MIEGSCLCGGVRWGIDAPPTDMTHCHCSMCRKAHGAAFATYAMSPREQFHWLQGEQLIARYASSPGYSRSFCSGCGSVVPADVAESEHHVDLPAGCFDDDPVTRPDRHIFAASKASWHAIEDDLPVYDEWSPDFIGAVVERDMLSAPDPGVLRGSCLCGEVAYEVSEAFKTVYNCHCSRCRKARAAAYTTNGFISADGVRFVRGAQNVASYKVPEARFFTHVYCKTCGSGVPRLDPGRGIANIPLGSLDDDPGQSPEAHIYVAWKAPWYDIPGDLPQFEERPG